MVKYMNTNKGLLTNEGTLIALDQYTKQTKTISETLPKYTHLAESVYWRKVGDAIELFEAISWESITLTEDMFRFMMVYDKGALTAKGGSNAASSKIGVVYVNGFRDTRYPDTEYSLISDKVSLVIRGSVVRVFDVIRRK